MMGSWGFAREIAAVFRRPAIGLMFFGALLCGGPATAGTLANLHNFTSACYNSLATPLFVSGVLYGVLNDDSNLDIGCIFSLKPDGASSPYKEVYAFKSQEDNDTNNPHGAPIYFDGYLYDTGFAGGEYGEGTVFRYQLSTGKEQVLHNFDALPGGISPPAGVGADSTGDLFGVALGGSFKCGDLGCGMVYEMEYSSTTGKFTYKILHGFTDGNDGNYPLAAPVVFNGAVYGTTSTGGEYNYGTVYELLRPTATNPNWTFHVIHQFTGGKDGAGSQASLTPHDGKLYGTTRYGGLSYGVVFEMTPPATSTGTWVFTTLYEFKHSPSDGAGPLTAPVFDGEGNLYGITGFGGPTIADAGIIYELANTTWKESILYEFPANQGTPSAGIVIGTDNRIYGLIPYGGKYGYGYAFSIAE